MKIHVAFLAALTVAFAASSSHALLVPTVIYNENFNGGLPGVGFTTAGAGAVTGVSNQAQLADSGGELAYYTTDTFTTEDFTVEADVTQTSGNAGNAFNGVVVGNIAFTFFGGFGGGAFNIYRYNTGTGALQLQLLGDTNMGYTPLQNVKQHYSIDVDPIAKTFDITISNTAGPGVFNYFFGPEASFIPGGVGFYNDGQDHTTLFDNLTVIALRNDPNLPEPGTWMMLGLGAAALAWRVTRRKVA